MSLAMVIDRAGGSGGDGWRADAAQGAVRRPPAAERRGRRREAARAGVAAASGDAAVPVAAALSRRCRALAPCSTPSTARWQPPARRSTGKNGSDSWTNNHPAREAPARFRWRERPVLRVGGRHCAAWRHWLQRAGALEQGQELGAQGRVVGLGRLGLGQQHVIAGRQRVRAAWRKLSLICRRMRLRPTDSLSTRLDTVTPRRAAGVGGKANAGGSRRLRCAGPRRTRPGTRPRRADARCEGSEGESS